jgi:hypothetical protein
MKYIGGRKLHSLIDHFVICPPPVIFSGFTAFIRITVYVSGIFIWVSECLIFYGGVLLVLSPTFVILKARIFCRGLLA